PPHPPSTSAGRVAHAARPRRRGASQLTELRRRRLGATGLGRDVRRRGRPRAAGGLRAVLGARIEAGRGGGAGRLRTALGRSIEAGRRRGRWLVERRLVRRRLVWRRLVWRRLVWRRLVIGRRVAIGARV